jgi:hypothetical protein
MTDEAGDKRGKRAVYGCCVECGETLLDATMLACARCRKILVKTDPEFERHEAGHRDRISDLYRGVRDGGLTFAKVNAIYDKKRKEKERGKDLPLPA